MSERRTRRFVRALLRQRRPPPFNATQEEADVLRAAIALRAANPAASLPAEVFYTELRSRLTDEEARRRAPVQIPGRSGSSRYGPSRFGLTRRGLLVGGAGLAAGVVATEGIDLGLRARESSQASSSVIADVGSWRPVIASAELLPGQVRRFSTEPAVGFLSRPPDGIRAVSGVCTHQGCFLRLNAANDTLECPCHSAAFATTGEVLHHERPAPIRPLPTFQVRERGGQVEILLPGN